MIICNILLYHRISHMNDDIEMARAMAMAMAMAMVCARVAS
mgnify:CR=1 FL=1